MKQEKIGSLIVIFVIALVFTISLGSAGWYLEKYDVKELLEVENKEKSVIENGVQLRMPIELRHYKRVGLFESKEVFEIETLENIKILLQASNSEAVNSLNIELFTNEFGEEETTIDLEGSNLYNFELLEFSEDTFYCINETCEALLNGKISSIDEKFKIKKSNFKERFYVEGEDSKVELEKIADDKYTVKVSLKDGPVDNILFDDVENEQNMILGVETVE